MKKPASQAKSSQTKSVSQTYWASEQDVIESPVSFDARLGLMKDFGSFSLAYSTAVQPRLKYWGDENGYIAYRQRWGQTFALADPVCGLERKLELLEGFIKEFKKPSFVQIGFDTARHLCDLGFAANEIGVDSKLELNQYDFKGKQKEWIRYAGNWIQRRDFQIREFSVENLRDQVESISEAWRETRTIKRKEVRFLNRPIVMDDETDVRRFGLFDRDQRLMAFIYFDPMYDSGQIVGYVTCIKRRHPDTPQYGETAITKFAIEQFQAENVNYLNLGLSPLANIENADLPHRRFLHKTTRYLHTARWVNRYFYNVQGHTQYKRRFRGAEESVYYASPVAFNGFRALALYALCGMI